MTAVRWLRTRALYLTILFLLGHKRIWTILIKEDNVVVSDDGGAGTCRATFLVDGSWLIENSDESTYGGCFTEKGAGLLSFLNDSEFSTRIDYLITLRRRLKSTWRLSLALRALITLLLLARSNLPWIRATKDPVRPHCWIFKNNAGWHILLDPIFGSVRAWNTETSTRIEYMSCNPRPSRWFAYPSKDRTTNISPACMSRLRSGLPEIATVFRQL